MKRNFPQVHLASHIVLQDRTGSGSLVIDSKKMFGIKHWIELTGDHAREQVCLSLKDGPFAYGPWGEGLSVLKPLFLKSVVNLTSIPQSAASLVPLDGEATINLDWALPMDAYCQGVLFQRIRLHFEKSTAIVDESQHRAKYRMNESDLMHLRNLVCVWGQVREFLSTRAPNFSELDSALVKGNTLDHEFAQVLEQRPAQFAASFLPSAQQAAVENIKKHEEVVTLEVQKQRQELRDAKWRYFQAALQRDQEILQTVQAAPKRLDALRHRKQMAWRVEQSQIGERIVKGYLEKHLRCDLVEKVEHGQLKVNEFRSFVIPGYDLEIVDFRTSDLLTSFTEGG